MKQGVGDGRRRDIEEDKVKDGMSWADKEIRKQLAEYGRKIARRHLVMGAMGNISARAGQRVWIKRGGAWLERARREDFIAVDISTGKGTSGQLPSKEVFLHLGCYRARADIGAVVHTHPLLATALATAGVSLDKNSAEGLRKIIGSAIATLGYFSPGSKKLAEEVKRVIKRVNAVLLAHHGLVCVGKDIAQAYQRTCSCEEEAKEILIKLKR